MLSLPKQELKGHFTMLPMDEVHFGSGSLENLSAELEKQGVSRAVIITGNTLAQNTNWWRRWPPQRATSARASSTRPRSTCRAAP